MKKKKKYVFIFAAATLLLAIIAGGGSLTRAILEKRILTTLHDYGFKDATIGHMALDLKESVFADITLDKDHFSTIKAIRYRGTPAGFSPRSVIIDDIKLLADYSRESGFSLTGWKKSPFIIPPADEITLNGASIDIDTPTDSLRFQAKGTGVRQTTDGSLKITAAVWGIQNQIKLESRWDALLYPDGTWKANIEFDNAGINLSSIQGSRINGWAALEKTSAPIPAINGQIDAGKITIGKISFLNANIAFEGSGAAYKIIAKGDVSGFSGMSATLDINSAAPLDSQVKAIVQTKSIDDLISFLSALQSNDQKSGRLTSLLLTQGNLDRLRKDVKQFSYDDLELEIYGAPYDLAGKVTTRAFKDGDTQKNVISLDPGQ